MTDMIWNSFRWFHIKVFSFLFLIFASLQTLLLSDKNKSFSMENVILNYSSLMHLKEE